jgi:hypothetical protein
MLLGEPFFAEVAMHRRQMFTRHLFHIALTGLLLAAPLAAWGQSNGVEAGPLVPPSRPAPEGNAATGGNQATQPSASTSIGDYIAGIEALESGEYANATTDFARALQAEGDNADYVRARGVAETLAEDFPAALTDLQRAMRIHNGNDREAKLWLAAAYRMSGDWEKGSLNFTYGGDIPNDYAFFVYDNVAQDYAMSRYRHIHFDKESHKNVPVDQIIKTHFVDAAMLYAQRHKAHGEAAAQAMMRRAAAEVNKQDWPAAVRDLQVIRQELPDDATVQSDWALALLGVGDALDARTELTLALSTDPLWTAGYLARARAAAMIGDSRRARADIPRAADGGKDVTAQRAEIEKLLADAPPEDAPARFTTAAAGDGQIAELVNAAMALRRWANSKRLRYDEQYQDRLGILALASKQEPDHADAPDLLAWFLYKNCNVPRLWDGPRGDGWQVRPQSPVKHSAELDQAIQYADAAFKLDPQRANALATKGWIYYTLKQSGKAEEIADQGLAIEGQNVPLLDLKMQVLEDHAADLAAHAAALRQPRSETHTEQRSDGEYRVTTTNPPTADQLAEARALEAQAAEIRHQAADIRGRADKVRNEIVPPLLSQAEQAMKSGDAAAALTVLHHVYLLWPEAPGLFDHLATVCQQQKDDRWQRIYAMLAASPQETTAASDLKTAWDAITRTVWQAGSDALARAASMDPCDARTFIYRSVLDANRKTPDPAAFQHDCRAALALEEARARLMGTTFEGDVPPQQAVDLLDPRDAALTMLLRNRLGDSLNASKQYQLAIDVFTINLAMERRFGSSRLTQSLPAVILPDPKAEALPQSPCVASVLAVSRLGMAKTLLGLGKAKDATEQYRLVRAYTANWPPTVEGREKLAISDAWARLGLGKLAFDAKDYDKANQIMLSEGFGGVLPTDLQQQIKQLSDQIMAARQQGAQNQYQRNADAQLHMTPQQRQVQGLKTYIQQLQQQRDALAKQIDDPATPEQVKKALQSTLDQMDQQIDQRKKELDALESPAPAK